jgi:hypothetical protein
MDVHTDDSKCYRVEVSGWDAKENFFVEKTSLDWAQEGRKEISLRASLRQGCIVFVRLLQSVTLSNTFPLAYQAVIHDRKDELGRVRVSLQQLHPRPPLRASSEVATDSILQCA